MGIETPSLAPLQKVHTLISSFFPPEVVVETGQVAMEPLIVHRMMVGKTVAETMTTGTWTTDHTLESMVARKANTTMMTLLRSRVQR